MENDFDGLLGAHRAAHVAEVGGLGASPSGRVVTVMEETSSRQRACWVIYDKKRSCPYVYRDWGSEEGAALALEDMLQPYLLGSEWRLRLEVKRVMLDPRVLGLRQGRRGRS